MQNSALVWSSRWIKTLGIGLIVYGLAMVFAPQVMNRTFVAPLLYGNDAELHGAFVAMREPDVTFINAMSGLLGTVTTGWAIQLVWIAQIPFRRGEQWAWNALGMSFSAWAVFEFIFKLVEGIRGAGLFAHWGLLIAMGIPLLATYRSFHPTPHQD